MKLFVTGGTGFIGSNFVINALRNNFEIICLARKGSSPRVPFDINPQWVYGNLDEEFDSTVFKGVDVLVHFAAHSANVPYDTLENCLYWNVISPLKLFNQALNSGVTHFLIAGSGFEYGLSGEEYEYIPPNAPLKPTSTYPISKAAASVTFSGWCAVNKVKMKQLRIFQVYGEGEAENRLWPSLRKAALLGQDYMMTEGLQVRDFISVNEVSKFFITELDFSNVKQGNNLILHVGTGNPMTVRSFAELWWKSFNATGKLIFGKYPYRPNEVMRYVPLINSFAI